MYRGFRMKSPMPETEKNLSFFNALDYVPLGLCAIDDKNHVVFWNRCLENWFSISKDEISHSSLCEYFPNLSNSDFKQRLSTVFTKHATVTFSHNQFKNLLKSKHVPQHNNIYHISISPVLKPPRFTKSCSDYN